MISAEHILEMSKFLGAGISMGMAAIGASIGIGYAGSLACSQTAEQPRGYSEVFRTMLIGQAVTAFVPTEGITEVIYKLDESTAPNPQYEGEPVVGIRRTDKSYTIITVPLVPFNGLNNIGEAIQILLDE